MSVSRGYLRVFYASLKACLSEIEEKVRTGEIPEGSLRKTVSELSCMKLVLEREESSLAQNPS